MATRAQMRDDMRNTYGRSYLSLTDVARYMGVNREQARAHLKNVPYIQTGQARGKRYGVADLAEMLFSLQVRK